LFYKFSSLCEPPLSGNNEMQVGLKKRYYNLGKSFYNNFPAQLKLKLINKLSWCSNSSSSIHHRQYDYDGLQEKREVSMPRQCPSQQATSHSADSMILTVARKIKWASISNRSPSRKGSLTEKPKHSRRSDVIRWRGEHGEPGPTGQGHGSTGICCNRARGPRRRRGTVQVGAYAPLARPGPIDDRSSGLGEQGFATRGTNHWARFHGLIAARNPSRHQ